LASDSPLKSSILDGSSSLKAAIASRTRKADSTVLRCSAFSGPWLNSRCCLRWPRPIPAWQPNHTRTSRQPIQRRFKVEVEKMIESARGKVEVDVLCRGNDSKQAAHYYVRVQTTESEYPQTVVHAFRTVVADTAADVGFIVTTSNYQPGAIAASVLTNIRICDWRGFQRDSNFHESCGYPRSSAGG
jgi:hypothetical protein